MTADSGGIAEDAPAHYKAHGASWVETNTKLCTDTCNHTEETCLGKLSSSKNAILGHYHYMAWVECAETSDTT